MSFASNHFAQHAGPDPVPLREEITRLRAELAEARALYVGAQEDLNEAVGNVVALRAELADYKADFEDMRDGTGRFAGEGYYDLRAELAEAAVRATAEGTDR